MTQRRVLAALGLALLLASWSMPTAGARRYVSLSFGERSWRSGNASRKLREASSLKVVLGVERHSIRRGGKVRVRIEDRGTKDVASTPRYDLARRSDGSWVRVPTGPFFAPRLIVRAGTSGPWQVVRLPDHAKPGEYRVRKWVESVESRHERTPIQAIFRLYGR
ncbi:MAG: immunoglobulin-like domain-containing protein [Solirubrobacterales bacterium]